MNRSNGVVAVVSIVTLSVAIVVLLLFEKSRLVEKNGFDGLHQSKSFKATNVEDIQNNDVIIAAITDPDFISADSYTVSASSHSNEVSQEVFEYVPTLNDPEPEGKWADKNRIATSADPSFVDADPPEYSLALSREVRRAAEEQAKLGNTNRIATSTDPTFIDADPPEYSLALSREVRRLTDEELEADYKELVEKSISETNLTNEQ